MKKFELSESEKKLIEKHLSGRYNAFCATDEELSTMNSLVEKATNLQFELDAFDECMENGDGDLLAWYLKKYNEQEKVNPAQ